MAGASNGFAECGIHRLVPSTEVAPVPGPISILNLKIEAHELKNLSSLALLIVQKVRAAAAKYPAEQFDGATAGCGDGGFFAATARKSGFIAAVQIHRKMNLQRTKPKDN